jgi:CubicO group peptidase (beta-lactamase class C family)
MMRFAAIVGLSLAVACGVKFPALAAETNQQRVDRLFAAYDKASSPGCALGVIRDGSFIYRRAYGMASLELGVPLSPQSVFYMGSVSKQFTAASVVLAAEQGFLSLDDDIRKYIPELPDYGHIIRLRQMLHHTSGFRDFLTLLDISGRHESDLHSEAEMLDLIVRQKGLNNVPGDEYIYSNTNYFLLGEVLQRATKKSLANFAAENIFQPLGMVHTRFYDDHTFVLPGRVPAYDPGSNSRFLVDWSTNYDTVGAGGLMSSVDDLLLWDRTFYQNKLGHGTLLKEMQTRGVLNNGKQIDYALGLELGAYRGLGTVEHGGELFAYVTEILRFPEQRFTVVCLCNLSSAAPDILSRNVADIFLEKDLQAEVSVLQPSGQGGFPDPSKFAGKYLDPRTHAVYSFTLSEGNLAAWGSVLKRQGPNRFKDLGSGIITFDISDGVMRASLNTNGQTYFAGGRINELNLDDSTLAAFVGLYSSTELDTTYNLSLNMGSLILRNKWNPALKLIPIALDEFDSDLGTLVFHRDADHRVSGLSMFSPNARNVEFEKVN